jgi:hypothetical protein
MRAEVEVEVEKALRMATSPATVTDQLEVGCGRDADYQGIPDGNDRTDERR